MIARFLFAAFFLVSSLLWGTSFAHQQKAALTEVLLNARSGKLEVAHQFLLHDAEHAVRVELGIDGDLYADPETQAAFAKYVADRFSLAVADAGPLSLSLLGTEIEGGYLWIYQEAPLPTGMQTLTVKNNALRDVWSEQTNRVNIKRGTDIRTLVFTGNVGEQSIEFSGEDTPGISQ